MISRTAQLVFKFGQVGAIGFGVDAGLLGLGLTCGLPLWIARALSLATALHVTFFLNGSYVFGTLRQSHLARQWVSYMIANGLGALCNYAIFVALTASALPFVSDHRTAFVLAAVAALGVNFTGSKLVAFRA